MNKYAANALTRPCRCRDEQPRSSSILAMRPLVPAALFMREEFIDIADVRGGQSDREAAEAFQVIQRNRAGL